MASKEVEVRDLEISTIAHATEDYSKVERAVLNILPPDLRDLYANRIEYQDTLGHYKNPIRLYRLEISGKDSLEILKWILGRLSRSEFETLLLSLEDRFDKRDRRFFIRLSKQDAYLGEIALGFDDDIIRVSIGISRVKSLRDLENFLRELVSK